MQIKQHYYISIKILTKVVVGSRLHNLHTENSDWDFRGVFIHPLRSVLSPFKKVKNTTWIEGNEDNTIFSLDLFVNEVVNGSPNFLEILFSDQVIETTPEFEFLKENRKKLLNSKAIFEGARNFANNQVNKMNLFDPDKRTPKFACAFLRVLFQARILLETGEMPVKMEGDFRNFLFEVKNNFSPTMIPELTQRFLEMQTDLVKSYLKNKNNFTPDISFIEDFLKDTMIKNN